MNFGIKADRGFHLILFRKSSSKFYEVENKQKDDDSGVTVGLNPGFKADEGPRCRVSEDSIEPFSIVTFSQAQKGESMN